MSENNQITREQIMKLPTHKNCHSYPCGLCYIESGEILQDYLEQETSDTKHDLLGHYHSWLSRQGINPENEIGWWSLEAWDINNIDNFIKYWGNKRDADLGHWRK